MTARKQEDYDVILCDTAGRMTKNSNLMQQSNIAK
jgi:signal recognition particle GTPase